MSRLACPLHPEIPLSNVLLRGIAVQALRKSPLRRLRTGRPTSEERVADAGAPDDMRDRDRLRTRIPLAVEAGGREPVSAPASTEAPAARAVAALPSAPMTSRATIGAVMAQDEDLITDVVTDACLAYLDLPEEERPQYPKQWFRTVIERLARREAHRHAWHVGMLLPAATPTSDDDGESNCYEDLACDSPTPEAIVGAMELHQQMEAAWGPSPSDRQLLEAVLTETVPELAAINNERPDTLHRRATTRRTWLRRVLHDLGYIRSQG